MQIYKLLIQEIKEKIDLNDFEGCKQFYNNLDFNDSTIPWDYVFQKVYLHACLKKKQISRCGLSQFFLNLIQCNKLQFDKLLVMEIICFQSK